MQASGSRSPNSTAQNGGGTRSQNLDYRAQVGTHLCVEHLGRDYLPILPQLEANTLFSLFKPRKQATKPLEALIFLDHP